MTPRVSLSRAVTTLCLLLGAMLLGTLPARAADLPGAVSRALQQADIPQSSVGIVVQPVDGGPPLLSHNARQAMNPASAMKLVTTYAALEMLGPAHTWRTEVLADARPRDGRINGNVYLRGGGDPKLALEQFWLLLRQLRTQGVREISGDLVLDRSAFALPAHDPGAFDNQPLRPYNAGPDALLVNFKSLRLLLQADAATNTVRVVAETPSEGLRIDNRLSLGRGPCGDWQEQITPVITELTIELGGSFPAACGERGLNLAPWTANMQVESLFRALWRELGGSFQGSVREGGTPAGATTLVVQQSPTLAEIVRDVNKYSNNVMARQIFLALDSERPATTAGARRQLTGWLLANDLQLPELMIDNGSGLSRDARISAGGLAQLLAAAWRSPVMAELISSLPVAGVDGTLRKRLKNGSAAGRAHLKTGYLEGVRAIAGYVLDNSGKRWIVVGLINDGNARLGKAALDALLLWVAER
ncbi:D-alanyl-D-alanine carboxypeptidase/D-alanyl-D-alanine-endopeptidase [Accumulibacter sp.]|uniref:D-alanyl-D-alanine carboxypeptidase/D-alanyl-D-alanine endopeptidase n=1 Tax=Accumulibacter sp. TaxID=2053492 RepID=UPI0025F991DD|nr:D-alanyl-D-alanine carboxypeptidase/D-alanyl-D-alanine-endopeptidase [Accumulibacter sp.]